MVSITLEAKTNILPTISKLLGTKVEESLDHGVITLIEVADQLTPIDTGALRGNKTIRRSSGVREVVWNQHYAIYQEFGTSRGVPASLFATQGADAANEAVGSALASWLN